MIYNEITKTDTYVQLKEGDNTVVMPLGSVITVDDESGLLSVKTTGSRKTIALVRNNNAE